MKILIFAILLCVFVYAFDYIIAIAFFVGLLGPLIGGVLALLNVFTKWASQIG
ncbi:hypothetical protein [uncultured Campylobacter sp.]|uniref:hypothetical protein n=1 Tax=uncultured Campylobacter sp. TaxID=218934 RepID=UPI0026043850|nr:hypothetical protein [uncultured Campylobacter sp.]